MSQHFSKPKNQPLCFYLSFISFIDSEKERWAISTFFLIDWLDWVNFSFVPVNYMDIYNVVASKSKCLNPSYKKEGIIFVYLSIEQKKMKKKRGFFSILNLTWWMSGWLVAHLFFWWWICNLHTHSRSRLKLDKLYTKDELKLKLSPSFSVILWCAKLCRNVSWQLAYGYFLWDMFCI
jgi:hypothetical protein